MKRILYLALPLIFVFGPHSYAQQKAKTFFVPQSERNYAQNLGGYREDEYPIIESTVNFDKKANKPRVEALACSSYDEAYAKLPGFPDVKDVDTREKMSDFAAQMEAYSLALKLHEPDGEVRAAGKRLADAQMENAKRAAKGQPYDSVLHFDPNAAKYTAIIHKIAATMSPVLKQMENTLSDRSVESECADFVLFGGIARQRAVFNEFDPLRRQMCHEWFASAACKKVAAMDAPLVERAKAEGLKRAPDWFVEGRKAEIPEVQAYNQQLVKRWIQKVKPHLEKDKQLIPKMMGYLKEVEALRNGGEMTQEYVAARLYAADYVEMAFNIYYSWLDFLRCTPLVETPPTMEGKKLKF
jgi:hypothetical protein